MRVLPLDEERECCRSTARHHNLGCLSVPQEKYDFIFPKNRHERKPIRAFLTLLEAPETRKAIEGLGFSFPER